MPLVMFRNFQWTLKYGMNDVAPAALTTLGIIFAGILGDLKGGVRCGEAAVALIPQVSSAVESRTLFVAHGFVLWWTQPLRDQFKPLLRAYEVGLSSGDTESACWSVHLFYHMRFSCSVSLDLILEDCKAYMAQVSEYV